MLRGKLPFFYFALEGEKEEQHSCSEKLHFSSVLEKSSAKHCEITLDKKAFQTLWCYLVIPNLDFIPLKYFKVPGNLSKGEASCLGKECLLIVKVGDKIEYYSSSLEDSSANSENVD